MYTSVTVHIKEKITAGNNIHDKYNALTVYYDSGYVTFMMPISKSNEFVDVITNALLGTSYSELVKEVDKANDEILRLENKISDEKHDLEKERD